MLNRGFICVVGLLGSTEDKELTDFAIFNFIDIKYSLWRHKLIYSDNLASIFFQEILRSPTFVN